MAEDISRATTDRLAPAETLHSRRTVTLILAGLLAGLLLAFMDVTIVSTAGPTIISELGGLSLYAWVFSAFLIVQVVTIPDLREAVGPLWKEAAVSPRRRG